MPKTFEFVGVGGSGRMTGLKQYYEIQSDPDGSTVYAPVYIRRRITLMTISYEFDYLTCIPEGGNDAQQWVQSLDGNGKPDWVSTASWSENGSQHLVYAPDDDGMETPLSGKWQVESKEMSSQQDGTMLCSVTLRNEGAWVPDIDRVD
jgi:hypothetical protein